MATAHGELTASWKGEAVSATAVERALSRVLRELNPPGEFGEPHPPARASVLNLIVHAPDAVETRAVEALGALAERHPSRTLVVTTDPGVAEPGLDAAVTAHCHLRPGTGGRVCFEEARLTVRGALVGHLASVVAPLLVPDLPVVLWWLGEPPEPGEELLQVCDRLIVSSDDLGSSSLARLAHVVESLEGRVVVGDLTWRALAPWREVLTELFDPFAARPYQRRAAAARLRYVAGGSAIEPLLLLGWLATRLNWTGPSSSGLHGANRYELRFERPGGTVDVVIEPTARADGFARGELLAVTLESRLGDQVAAFEVVRHEDGICAVQRTTLPGLASVSRVVPLARPALAALLGHELGRASRDRGYEASLELVGCLAD